MTIDLARVDRDAWYTLPLMGRVAIVAAYLEVTLDSPAARELVPVPPSRVYEAMNRRQASLEHGFPADPTEGDVWTAWDGSRWRFGRTPWWDLIGGRAAWRK